MALIRMAESKASTSGPISVSVPSVVMEKTPYPQFDAELDQGSYSEVNLTQTLTLTIALTPILNYRHGQSCGS